MIRKRHLRTCRRAGVKEIRVHDLRHTYASHYVMSGGSLSDLQALLGHLTFEITRKYAHLTSGTDNRKLDDAGRDNPVTTKAEIEVEDLPQNVIRLQRF